MTCLVDANVLSEVTRLEPNPRVVRWLTRNEASLVIDPFILGELRFGILLLPRGKRRSNLERWFEEGIVRMRCLSWEPEVGLRWAELLATLRRSGRSMPVKDSLIAATALAHGLPVATLNSRDFRYAGVELVDPTR